MHSNEIQNKLKNPIRHAKITSNMSVDQLVREFDGCAFGAGRLAEAVDIYCEMLTENTTKFFGLAGAMVPAGMRSIVADLIRDGYIDDAQARDASEILFACSLTYVASSLLSILNIWPWIGRPMARAGTMATGNAYVNQLISASPSGVLERAPTPAPKAGSPVVQRRRPKRQPLAEKALRRLAKPLIRCWLRAADFA